MKNIKLTIQYIGTNFFGFQSQPKLRTVQSELEKALTKTFKEDIKVVAAGRTDVGVHAFGQVVNFYAPKTTIDIGNMPKVINYHLPDDLSISNAEYMPKDFSARYNALGKHYRYIIYNSRYRNALYVNRAAMCPHKLDIELMKEGAKYFIGRKDFKSFMGKKSVVKDSIRILNHIDIDRTKDIIYLNYYGKSFLRNMLRIITGTLVEIGRGRIAPEDVPEILNAKRRTAAGPTLDASGLYLMKVFY
ncbi:MAG: tRNA pseudouridine(38-40) synthase TruA [Tissierellia bacterium]|nr:tRNA pseudouridine(38-40) synthase TruA [Tissierellia bacterium]